MLDYEKTRFDSKSLDGLISKIENSGEDDSALNMLIDFVPETKEIGKKLEKIVDRCNNEKDELYNWSNEDLIKEIKKIQHDYILKNNKIMKYWYVDFNSVSIGSMTERQAEKESNRISDESGLGTSLYYDEDSKEWTVDTNTETVQAYTEKQAFDKAMKEYGKSDYGQDFEINFDRIVPEDEIEK